MDSEKKNIEINLKKADYEQDSDKAREILNKIKDEGTIKKHTGESEKAGPSHIKPEDLIKED